MWNQESFSAGRRRQLERAGRKMAIDKVLSKPIEAGLIPGIVALAADEVGIIYKGAFGRRAVGKPEPMTLELGVSHCVDDKGHHRHGCNAAG